MFILDAFRAFDREHGVLTSSRLYSVFAWLGLKMRPKQIHDLVRSIDSDHDGVITFDDFKRAFYDPSMDPEAGGSAVGSAGDGHSEFRDIQVEQKQIREFYDQSGEVKKTIEVPGNDLDYFKVKSRPTKTSMKYGTASEQWLRQRLAYGPRRVNEA